MRIQRLILALTTFALLFATGRAQNAVLVLSPSPAASVLAGTGSAGFRGDGASATSAQLAAPSAMAQDAQGNLYIADTRNHRIRRIATDGTITTVAGTGAQGFSGDEGPASQAQLDSPAGVAIASDGTVVIADTHNHRIRRIDAAGTIHTIAGTGVKGFSGDGGAAISAQLNAPLGVALGLTGDLYVADAGNHRIRHIGADGTISTVAGDAAQGISPDGTQAIAAHLDAPASVTVRPDGSVLIADRGNNRILLLQTDGILHTVNTASLSLRRPSAVATNTGGDTLIADTGNYRVAQITSSGAGSALGSGEQGSLDPSVAPVATPLGAPAAVIDTGAGGTSAQFSVIDRDRSQLVQVAIPQLRFADTIIATASTPQSLLLRNAGSGTLSVVSVAPPASFAAAATSSCGSAPFQIATGASCSLELTFTPQTVGAVNGTLQVIVQDGLPQRVILTGTGLPTGTQLTSSTSLQTSGSLSYAGTPLSLTAAVIGGSPAAATGTITFLDGTAELGRSTLNTAAQATLTTSTLPAGTHILTARYNGDAHYLGSTSTSTSVTVTNPPDFTMAANSSQLTLQNGSAGALSLTLQPVSGVLNQTVTLKVDGLPAGAAVNITPVPVTISSDPVTVNIAFKLPVSVSQREHRGLWLACMAPLLLVLSRKPRHTQTLLLLTTTALLPLLQGCGGGYLSGKSVTAQSTGSTYAVTVTAACPGVTGATITHSTTFTVEVQP